jgi:hypothetical protein
VNPATAGWRSLLSHRLGAKRRPRGGAEAQAGYERMAALYKAQARNRGPSPDRSNQSSSHKPSLVHIEPGGAALAGRKRRAEGRRTAAKGNRGAGQTRGNFLGHIARGGKGLLVKRKDGLSGPWLWRLKGNAKEKAEATSG